MVYRFFQCPKCNSTSTAGAWNTTTLKLCTNRTTKRNYRPIQAAGKARKWYQCPVCDKPSHIADIKPMQLSDVYVDAVYNDKEKEEVVS